MEIAAKMRVEFGATVDGWREHGECRFVNISHRTRPEQGHGAHEADRLLGGDGKAMAAQQASKTLERGGGTGQRGRRRSVARHASASSTMRSNSGAM